MDGINRRGLGAIIGSFALYALVGEARAAAKTGGVARWIDEQQGLAHDHLAALMHQGLQGGGLGGGGRGGGGHGTPEGG